MDNVNNTTTSSLLSPSIENSTPQRPVKKNIYKYLFYIIVLVLFTGASLYFLSSNKNIKNIIINSSEVSVENSGEKTESSTSWSKPISTDQIVPVVKKNKLYYYSTKNKILQSTEYSTLWGGGSMDFGRNNPLASPDGKYIVFINEDDNNSLYLLSGGSQNAVKLTDYPVQFINSWSTDSSKILFNSKMDNLLIRKEGEEIPDWDTTETFSKNTYPGFHYFNINTGKDIALYPLVTAENFIDSENILVGMKHNRNLSDNRLVIFNVEDFTADFTAVNFPIKSFNTQRSFTNDGKIWVTNFDNGRTEGGTKIVYAEFPSLEGDVIDSGEWAMIQSPLVSPLGEYVAYTKAGQEISPGRRLIKTIIWDHETKKIIKETEGIAQYWFNQNTILINVYKYQPNYNDYLSSMELLDISTGKTETILIE